MSSISSPQILVFIVLRNIFSSLEFAQLSFLCLILQQGLRPQASGSQGNNCQVVKYTECGKCGRCVFPFHWFLFLHMSALQRNLCPRIFTGASVQLCRAVRSSLQRYRLELPGKQSYFHCKNIFVGQRHCMNTANIFTVKINKSALVFTINPFFSNVPPHISDT